MIKPIVDAPIAVNNTAPAATSLARPIKGSKSLVVASASSSKAVFNASAVQTEVMANTIQHHSAAVS